MMKYLFTVVFCLVVGFSFGQAVGDYRSRASGNWNSYLSWERYVGAPTNAFVPLIISDATPTSANQVITILNGHIISVVAGVTIDQTTVESGATLTVNIPNIFQPFTVLDGTGTDLIVDGNFQVINVASRVRINGQLDVNNSMIVSSGQTVLNNSGTAGAVVVDGNLNFTGGSISVATGAFSVNGSMGIAGGTFSLSASSVVAVNGQVNYSSGTISGSSLTNFVFNSGAIYNQNEDGTVPVAGWSVGSLCRISGNVNSAPAGLDQTFYDFEWDTPLLSSEVYLDLPPEFATHDLTFTNTNSTRVFLSVSSNLNTTISGDLTYTSNAVGVFAYGSDVTLNIGGDFNFDSPSLTSTFNLGNVILDIAGDFNLNSGTLDVAGIDDFSSPPSLFPATGITQIRVGGNFTHTLGADIINSAAVPSLDVVFDGNGIFTSAFVPTFPINYSTGGAGNVSIADGSYLAGPGSLTVNTGTSISLLSLEASGALQNGTTAGNVRVPVLPDGNRVYDGTIVYAGAGSQFISGDHPSAPDTRINITSPGASLTMLDDVTFSGLLDMADGELEIGANLLTIAGPYTKTSGNIWPSVGPGPTFTPLSSLAITGSGAFAGDLVFFGGTALVDFTLARPSTVIPLGANLNVAGTFTLTDGDLYLAPANRLSLFGTFTQSSGRLSVDGGSELLISGSGALPASPIVFTGSSISFLRMDRTSPNPSGSTFNTSTPLTVVTTLFLKSGSVNSANLTMGNGSVINVGGGDLVNEIAVAAAGQYDVFYSGVNSNRITTDEIPTNPSVLRNVTVNNNDAGGPWALTLQKPLFANGNLVVQQGNFVTNALPISVGGNLSVTSPGIFTPGTSTITFNGGAPQVISSNATLALTNVIVNQSASSSVTLSSPMTVTTSFAVNSVSTVNVGSNLLTLQSDATTTAFVPEMLPLASIVGSVIVRRILPNTNGSRAYRYLSPQTSNTTVADWRTELQITGPFTDRFTGPGILPHNYSMYRYIEPNATTTLESGYQGYPLPGTSSGASPLASGVGYAVFLRTNGVETYDSRGTLGQQDVNVTVTNSSNPNSGWNLVGNPYPAAIDWEEVFSASTGIDAAIYLTNNNGNGGVGTTVSYSAGVGTGNFDGVLAPGQGFWVLTPGGGSVSFRESHKVSGQTQFFRKAEIPNVLHIKMKNQNTIDDIALRLHEEATDAFDSKLDAYKFGASGLNISFLSADNKKLSINSISNAACDNTVSLLIEGGVNGNYTLDFSGLDTFNGDVALYLDDKVENTRVALATTPQYAFAVSDVSKLKDRFELVIDGPSVEAGLEVAGESICETSSTAMITLQNSQPNVKYSAQWNGQIISSSEIMGNGGILQIPVTVAGLPHGDHEVTINAQMSTCEVQPLINKALLSVIRKGAIERVENGSACESGTVLLKVLSRDASGFNWYEDVSDVNAIPGQNGAEFRTPELTKSKTYYVAAMNTNGCEGDRVAVQADITNLEEVTIQAEGTVLTSNYNAGNQWYVDGLPIDNATSSQIKALISGIYTVEVTVNGCKTISAAREMFVTGMEESISNGVQLYPNPTTDKITVQVKTFNTVSAQLISSVGVSLNTISLEGDNGIKEGVFDLMQYPIGMYMVRIEDGEKVYIKKISKVK